MTVKLDRDFAFWVPPSLGADEPEFNRTLVHNNLARLRIVAWVLVFFMPLAAILDVQVLTGLNLPNLGGLLLQDLAVRFILAAGPALFLVACRPPEDAVGLTDRHRFFEIAFVLFGVIGAAAVAGLGQQVRPTIGAYLLAIFIASAFLTLSVGKSLLAYIPAFAVFAALVIVFQPNSGLVISDLVNGGLMTLLALIVSRVQYASRARDFLNQRLVERQRAELERANLQLAETNEILRKLSFLDTLTDIPNRRYFDEFLAREWTRAIRDRTPLSLIMLDIDHFKQFNDNHGHQMGDSCLIQVALALRGLLKRPADFLARYGGEEFVAILPNTDLAGALQIANQMRQRVAGLDLTFSESYRGGVTISLGVASCEPAQREIQHTLINAADRALYRAKAAGRNQCAWDSQPVPPAVPPLVVTFESRSDEAQIPPRE